MGLIGRAMDVVAAKKRASAVREGGSTTLRRTSGTNSAAHAILIAIVVFAAIAPTLAWTGFFNSMENLNVETALEIRRTRHWAIPTLMGATRIVKPPLTAWLTALTVRSQTLEQMKNANASVRDHAFLRFTWETRWFSLLCACAMLLAVYDLGRALGGRRLGMLSMLICASTFLFLHFARTSLTDVHLALWVSAANAFLARAAIKRQRWLGCIGAGVSLGLALMSKGPPALAQSVLPVVVYLGMVFYMKRRGGGAQMTLTEKKPSWLWPILVGVGLMLLIELPWYIYVLARLGSLWRYWLTELMGSEDPTKRADALYSYPMFLVIHFAPWTILIFAGAAHIVRRAIAGRGRRMLLAICLLLVPLVVMSFFKLKKERYLLPMVGSASVLAAAAVLGRWRLAPAVGKPGAATEPQSRDHFTRTISGVTGTLHWIFLGTIALGAPIAAATGVAHPLRTPAMHPSLAVLPAIATVLGIAAMLTIGIRMQRRRPTALVVCTFVVMLALQAVFAFALGKSISGQNDFQPITQTIDAKWPGARIILVTDTFKPAPVDLWIFFDRRIESVKPAKVATMTRQPAPVIALLESRQKMTTPSCLAKDWQLIEHRKHGDDWWDYYVLPPAN